MAGKNHKINCHCALCILPKGPAHWKWKGDAVKYRALHQWMENHYGIPKKCEDCGSLNAKIFVWANVSGKYKRIRSDWKRLCGPCHSAFDGNRGETHYRSKLTENDVRKIKEIHKYSKNVTQPMIARMFKVSRECICSIVNGNNWKHIIIG